MERQSSFERVVGDISEAEKERILQERAEIFNDQIFNEFIGEERDKTPEELKMISLANEITNGVRAKYGLEDFDIPPKNIHIMKKDKQYLVKYSAAFDAMAQSVAVFEEELRVSFMRKVIHEMLHFKSYSALQITSNDHRLDEYRVGLSIGTRDGKTAFLNNLNEAVTEEITKRSIKIFSKDPFFADEMQKTQDAISQYPDAVNSHGVPLFNDDVFYAEVKEEDEDTININTKAFVYVHERASLNVLMDKILEKNKEKFKDREEIFEVFARGMMTGNILPIGRLIDGSFGAGTLRRIGELDESAWRQLEFVNSLK